MRIVLIPSAFHPSLGGVEELTRQLAHAHRAAGHEVIVVTERWPRDLPAAELFEALDVRRFPMRVPTGHWRANLSYAMTHRRVRQAVAQAVDRFGADVLHVQCVSSTTLYALEAKRMLGLPLVVTLQGELSMDAAGIFDRPGIAQEIMRRALDEADYVTACSRQTLEEAEGFIGRKLPRAKVVYNGIDTREFAFATPFEHPRPYVLAIGRHVPQKGFDVLLRAFAQTPDTHDLILAGDGTEREALRRLSTELGLSKRVVFPGRVDHAKAVSLFAGCAFFVLPSRHEPLGIVNLEAMAAGKAVIASRVGGVAEIVPDGECGLLVPGGAVGELVNALRRLMTDDVLRDRLARRAKAHAATYDWRSLAEEYHGVYALTRRGAVRPAEHLKARPALEQP